MSDFIRPRLAVRGISTVRDWVFALECDGDKAMPAPHGKAKDWTLTRLRLCRGEEVMGCLVIRANGRALLVVPLVALANGEWFKLGSPLMLSDTDVVTLQCDSPITLALAGLYLLRGEEKS